MMPNHSSDNTTAVVRKNDDKTARLKSDSGSLSAGGIVGITLAVVVVVLFIFWLIFRYYRSKKSSESTIVASLCLVLTDT